MTADDPRRIAIHAKQYPQEYLNISTFLGASVVADQIPSDQFMPCISRFALTDWPVSIVSQFRRTIAESEFGGC
jgi:hypothetical protein